MLKLDSYSLVFVYLWYWMCFGERVLKSNPLFTYYFEITLSLNCHGWY